MEDTTAATDPIPNMDDEKRQELCTDVTTAKLFETKLEFDNLISNDYEAFLNSVRPAELDYKEMTVNVANKPIRIPLLCCYACQQYVYISYGFTDHYYFVFVDIDDDSGIRLLALAEPTPVRDDSFQDQEALEAYYWDDLLDPGN